MLSFDRPGGRALSIVAGLVILLVATPATVLGTGGGPGLVVAAPLAVVMTALAVWIILSGASGVRVRNGVSVGGGPMSVRATLDPGESVVAYAVAGYESGDRLTSAAMTFSGRLTGECFITDHRVIMTPQRMMTMFGWRGFDFPVDEVKSITPVNRVRMMGMTRGAIEFRLRDGRTYVIWPRSEELREALLGFGSGSATRREML